MVYRIPYMSVDWNHCSNIKTIIPPLGDVVSKNNWWAWSAAWSKYPSEHIRTRYFLWNRSFMIIPNVTPAPGFPLWPSAQRLCSKSQALLPQRWGPSAGRSTARPWWPSRCSKSIRGKPWPNIPKPIYVYLWHIHTHSALTNHPNLLFGIGQESSRS